MADRFSHQPREVRAYVEEVLAQAVARDAFAVVLTGSVARDAVPGLWSDLDLIVVNLDPETPPDSVHLFEVKVSDVEDGIRSGDDVLHWAARYGQPLHGHDRWTRLVEPLLREAPWPDYRAKVRQAARRLDVSRALLSAGDARSAQKELVYASSHLARALLLAQGEFPLSRPELPAQLRATGEAAVASAVDSLASRLITSLDELRNLWELIDLRRRDLAAAEAELPA